MGILNKSERPRGHGRKLKRFLAMALMAVMVMSTLSSTVAMASSDGITMIQSEEGSSAKTDNSNTEDSEKSDTSSDSSEVSESSEEAEDDQTASPTEAPEVTDTIDPSSVVSEDEAEIEDITDETDLDEEDIEDSETDAYTESYLRDNVKSEYATPDKTEFANVMTVKQTFFDGTYLSDTDTLDTVMGSIESGSEDYADAFYAQFETMVAVYNLSDESDYYVALIDTMQGSADTHVQDVDFALNNVEGIVVDGCIYDYDTGIAYIPKSAYYSEEDGGEALDYIQAQLMQVMTAKENTETETIAVSEDSEGDATVKSIGSTIFDLETTVQAEAGLSADEITVSMNGVPITDDMYTYDSETGEVTIDAFAPSVGTVSVSTGEDTEVASIAEKVRDLVGSVFGVTEAQAATSIGKVTLRGKSYDVLTYATWDSGDKTRYTLKDIKVESASNYLQDTYTKAFAKADYQSYSFTGSNKAKVTEAVLKNVSKFSLSNLKPSTRNDSHYSVIWLHDGGNGTYKVTSSDPVMKALGTRNPACTQTTYGSGSSSGIHFTDSEGNISDETYSIALNCAHISSSLYPSGQADDSTYHTGVDSVKVWERVLYEWYVYNDDGTADKYAIIGLVTPRGTAGTWDSQAGTGLIFVKYPELENTPPSEPEDDSVYLIKADSVTGTTAQGDGDLEGAVFRIDYYATTYSTFTHTWTTTSTDDEGNVTTQGHSEPDIKATTSSTAKQVYVKSEWSETLGKYIIPLSKSTTYYSDKACTTETTFSTYPGSGSYGVWDVTEVTPPAGYNLSSQTTRVTYLSSFKGNGYFINGEVRHNYTGGINASDLGAKYGSNGTYAAAWSDTLASAGTITDTVITGSINISKRDIQNTSAQGDGSLAGIKFEIRNGSTESVIINGTTYAENALIATLTTDANGNCSISGLPYGSYLVSEVVSKTVNGTKYANDSYLWNSETYYVSLNQSEPGATVLYTTVDSDGNLGDIPTDPIPFYDEVVRGGVRITKNDTDYEATKGAASGSQAQGDGTLAGITFTITNKSTYRVWIPEDSGIDLVTANATKATYSGKVYYIFDSGKVIGTITTRWDATLGKYVADTTSDALPYGTYTIQETATNYDADGNAIYQLTDGTARTFAIRTNGEIVTKDTSGNNLIFTNDVSRGGAEIVKVDEERTNTGENKDDSQGDVDLSGITYEIVNYSTAYDGGSKAEVYVNGVWYSTHGNDTTGNGSVVETITTKWDGSRYVAKTSADTLPYGTYKIYEIPYKYVVYDENNVVVDEYIAAYNSTSGAVYNYIDASGNKFFTTDRTNEQTFAEYIAGATYSVATSNATIKAYANSGQLYTDSTIYTFEVRKDGEIVTDYTSLTLDAELKEARTSTTYNNYTDTAYMTFVNYVARGGITLVKRDTDRVDTVYDSDTEAVAEGIEKAQGDDTLAGVTFAIINVSSNKADGNAAVYVGYDKNGTPCSIYNASTKKWVDTGALVGYITTKWDADYTYVDKDGNTVTGAYVASTAADACDAEDYTLPYGTYKVFEVASYTYINGVKTAVTYTWDGSKMVYKLANGSSVTTQLYANDGTLLTDESVYTYEIRYDGVVYASATDKSLDYSESSGWVGTGTSGSQKYSSTYADEKTTLFEGTQDTVNFVNDVARGGVEVVKLDTERYDTDTGETWSQGDGSLEGVTYVIKNVSSAADGGSNAYVCIYYDASGNVIDAEDYSEADGDHYRWVSTNGGVAAHISTFWDAKYSYVDKDGNTITGAYVATTDTDHDGYDDTEGALPYGTYTIQEVVYKYVVYDSTHDAVDEFVLVTDKYGDITGYTNGTKTVGADGTTKLTVSDLGYGEGYSVVLYANDSSLYTDETVYTFEIREDGKIVTDYTALTLDAELKEASTATTYGNYTDTAYMTFVNDVVRGDVLIYKYDTETNVSSALGGDGITETTENGTTLEGIVFTIYNISECDDGSDSDAAIYAGDGKWYATGDVVTTITTEWSDEYNAYVATTGTDGFLPYGTYAIVENPSDQLNDVYRANSSYLLGTDATIFEIRYDGEIVTCGNYWDDDYYYDTASGATSKDTASHTPYVLYEGDTALDIIYMAYENRSNVLLATKAGGDTYQCLEGTIIYGYDKTFSVTSSTGYTYTNKDGKTVTLNADEISIVPIGGTGVSFDADDILYARKYGANTKSDLLNLLAAKNANEQVRAADDNYNTLAVAVALDNDDPDTRDNVNSLIFHDQVVRNDVEFSKVDKNGNGLETIWVLTNNSTGEQHVLVTDENGVYDSSKIKHSTNTNANDALLDECLEAIENMSDLTLDGGWKTYVNNDDFDYQCGTWFGLTEADVNGTTVMADVDDALSALPYGRYTLQEVPSTSNSGYGMVSYVFMIDTDSTMTEIEDLGTFVNDDTPEMQTVLMSTEDDELLGNKTVRGEVVTLVDTIEYARLTAGMNYIFKTQLVNSGNGDILWEGWSEPFTAQDEDSTQPYYYQNGTAKVYLENVDLSEYTGTSVTAYEYLYTYTGEMYPEEEYDGADLHIGTTLVDSTDSNHVVEAGEETTLTDTVKYYNLDKGTTYTIVGVLMDKATGEPLTTTETVETTEEDGTVTTTTITRNILARASFTAEETSGSADITFTLDTSSLEGKQLVAYEYLFTGDVYPETSTDTTVETLPGTIGEVNTDDASASHEDIGDKYQTVEVVKTDDHGADELVDEHVEIDDEDQTVDVVGIGTTLVDSETGTHDSQADKDVILIDTVEYKGLEPGATYTLYGVLMDKSTGKKFVDYDKQNPTAIKTFVPKDSSGTIEVVFEFNATGKENVTVVAYEYLFEGAKKDVDVNNDTPIDTHEDLGDADQTVHFPHIGTTLLDGQTAAHVANADGTVTLNDTIAYTNLTVGEIYSVKGVLMDKATGKEMKDAKGNTITASTNFTCKSTNGSITLPFTFDATGLEGSTVVAYEYLMASAEVDEDMIVAEHEDIDDEDQTVYVPEIGTTLTDEDGYHETLGREDMVFTDTVEYTNLLPGTEYTIYGILMDKATGKPIKDDNDNYIFARKFFTPKESSGTVKVKFDFDGYEFDDGALTGVTVVAYEYLFVGDVRTGYKNAETDDKLVASHTDIDDEAQSIIIPAIHTTLADVAGNHETGTGEGVSLIDRVYFENLVVGEDYTISGALHYAKGTGSKAKDQGVLEDSTGTAYTASVSFKATKSSGYIDIEFVVDTSDLNGYTIVAFEELSDSGTVIATHEDITDEDQSVTVDKNVSVATSAKPQTGLGTMLPILFAIMAGCGVLAAYVLKRKKVKE